MHETSEQPTVKPVNSRSESLQLLRELVPNRLQRWIAGWLLWTAVAFLSATVWWFFPQGNYPYTWWELFAVKAGVWYVWGLFTPAILWLGSRFRLDASNRAGRLIILASLSVVITLCYLAAYSAVILSIINDPRIRSFDDLAEFVVTMHFTWYFLAFWMIIGIEHGIAYYRRYIERERRNAALESQLTQAQLERLKSQLQPHFLFNSLNTISSLVLSDRRSEAYDTLADLAALLRLSLERSQAQVISLHDELEFTRLYCDVMARRFPEQLKVEWDIDSDTIQAEVPSLFLQPLVENAIRHGSAGSGGNVTVSILAQRRGEFLVIQLCNDRDAVLTGNAGAGLGLANLRERLGHIYGERAAIEITDRDPETYTVTLRWPYRRIAVAETSYEFLAKQNSGVAG